MPPRVYAFTRRSAVTISICAQRTFALPTTILRRYLASFFPTTVPVFAVLGMFVLPEHLVMMVTCALRTLAILFLCASTHPPRPPSCLHCAVPPYATRLSGTGRLVQRTATTATHAQEIRATPSLEIVCIVSSTTTQTFGFRRILPPLLSVNALFGLVWLENSRVPPECVRHPTRVRQRPAIAHWAALMPTRLARSALGFHTVHANSPVAASARALSQSAFTRTLLLSLISVDVAWEKMWNASFPVSFPSLPAQVSRRELSQQS